MKYRNLFSLITTAFMFLAMAAGCAKYATEGRMMARIEKEAAVGISEKEFKIAAPQARLVEEKGGKRIYLVIIREPCFICSHMEAFLRSFEVSATKFTFNEGILVSADRISMDR